MRSTPMTADPRLRASDDDRDRAATLLREHHAVGRLTAEEFNERLDKVYAARTMGDLDGLLADLPGIDLYRLPVVPVGRRAVGRGVAGPLDLRRAPGARSPAARPGPRPRPDRWRASGFLTAPALVRVAAAGRVDSAPAPVGCRPRMA